MLEKHRTLAIFMEGYLDTRFAKMGEGVIRYIENPICCVVDSRNAGKKVAEVSNIPSDLPIVAGIAEAVDRGAEVLVLGTAPSGGRIPDVWRPVLQQAVDRGLSIVNGLHDRLADQFGALRGDRQWIWDVRQPLGEAPAIASGLARKLDNVRLLLVGTDMAIGKMTAGLEIHRWLRRQDVSACFLATGQIGMTITGRGIPLDAYKVDHACGAVEQLVMGAANHDVIIVEGQGSLLHPGSSATLPLIRGSCANRFILCHRAGFASQDTNTWVKIPPLAEFIALNEALASACGSLTSAQTVGIALNTRDLDEQGALDAIDRTEQETGLPVQDVVRFGAGKLASLLVPA